jgi:hypothetical protein
MVPHRSQESFCSWCFLSRAKNSLDLRLQWPNISCLYRCQFHLSWYPRCDCPTLVVMFSRDKAQVSRGCCPNKNPLSSSLKRFLKTDLGEAKDMRCQLFEPGGRVLTSPGASLRFVKKRFRTREKGFGQQPMNY